MEEEFKFIDHLQSLFAWDQKEEEGLLGIGDDCSVIPWPVNGDVNRVMLVTKDLLIEDIHFKLNSTSGQDLGVKAVAVNFSDIAAMGGIPRYAFLGLSVPANLPNDWVQDFLLGMQGSMKKSAVKLLGGDTTGSPGKVMISLSVLGEVTRDRIKLRSMAKVGDVVVSTGFLGDSGAGLLLLSSKGELAKRKEDFEGAERVLTERHLRPQAHLAEGWFLGSCAEVHAMMDVSDGVDADARKISQRSQCTLEIDLDRLPLSPELSLVAGNKGWNGAELAATAGEDYCLLLTVEKEAFASLNEKFLQKFKRPLYPIGKVVKLGKEDIVYFDQGKRCQLSKRGYQHFT